MFYIWIYERFIFRYTHICVCGFTLVVCNKNAVDFNANGLLVHWSEHSEFHCTQAFRKQVSLARRLCDQLITVSIVGVVYTECLLNSLNYAQTTRTHSTTRPQPRNQMWSNGCVLWRLLLYQKRINQYKTLDFYRVITRC